MKKLFILVIVLLVAIFGLSFAKGQTETGEVQQEDSVSDDQDFVVGYSAAILFDALQVAWKEAAEQAVEDAGGVMITVNAQDDLQKQVGDIEDLINQNIDVLLVNPTDENGLVPVAEKVIENGIPIITLDRGISGVPLTSSVGFDNYGAGYQAGKYIAKVHDGKGKVAHVMGRAGQSVTRERAQGFIDAISEYPDMEIVSEQDCNWETGKAQSFIEDVLIIHPDIIGVWAHSDDLIMGAVQALKDQKKTDQVTTVGMGFYGGGPDAVKEGLLSATFYLYPEMVGGLAGEAAVKVHNDESVEEKLSTPMDIVTIENVDEFYGK
jgi:ribose transport system substrate-binding protein